ncbi:MAG: slipin family protein [Candidatus Pacebacteria bacterium]|nr:slipin family protein [Candidatus Paceibacterota bacterium]
MPNFFTLWGSLTYLPIIIVILVIFIRQVNQYQRGVMFTLGKFTGIKEPGWRLVIPIFQSLTKVDIRTKAVDVPDQEVITKDNIPVKINAVVYYKIKEASKAILEVEDFYYATSQVAQTTMRNFVGERSLDDLLQKRAEIALQIKERVDDLTDPWGIDIESVELKDVIIPEDLKRTISKEAEAEREKRAVIIKADGDRIAADNLALAAQKLSSVPGAMHLRTLQAINDLSSDQSNTTIWMIPVEALEAIKGYSDVMNKKNVESIINISKNK